MSFCKTQADELKFTHMSNKYRILSLGSILDNDVSRVVFRVRRGEFVASFWIASKGVVDQSRPLGNGLGRGRISSKAI